MQRHATMCYCYQLKGCCNDFLCKYTEKSVNPRRVITQYIIKGTIYSLTRNAILSCQNHIACLLLLSFEKKVTNKNPFCCCLWKRKSLLRKIVTKKTPRHFTIFSRMTNNSSCGQKWSQYCTISGHVSVITFQTNLCFFPASCWQLSSQD